MSMKLRTRRLRRWCHTADLAATCITIARPNRVSMAPSRRSHARRSYDACSALVNSANSARFKSDTAQNDMPLWIQ
jgi:hypothetical protein